MSCRIIALVLYLMTSGAHAVDIFGPRESDRIEAMQMLDGNGKPMRDKEGRLVVRGPFRLAWNAKLDNVHIVSNSYGVIAGLDARITNSFIEAPVCIQTPGAGLYLEKNWLQCDLAVEFQQSILFNNIFDSNTYTGTFSNHPSFDY